MSYTMTLDMPQREAAYVARHRAQFQSELNARTDDKCGRRSVCRGNVP